MTEHFTPAMTGGAGHGGDAARVSGKGLRVYPLRTAEGQNIRVGCKGRPAWALDRLLAAGARGVTPVDEPAGPRWSAYVADLRALGLPIETLREAHGGQFPGHHGRYVLHAKLADGGGDGGEVC
jgi:hypothetical protein